MTNHFHLLVMEKDWKIAEVIKSLASSYVYYYNKKNERIELSPNGPFVAVNVPAGQWHRVYAKVSGTVLMESKDGKWEPLTDVDVLS